MEKFHFLDLMLRMTIMAFIVTKQDKWCTHHFKETIEGRNKIKCNRLFYQCGW